MTSATATANPTAGDGTSRVVRLWSDTVRKKQRARLKKLKTRQFEEARAAGRMAHAEALKRCRGFPEYVVDLEGQAKRPRIDVPTPDVFALVLGVFRAGATLSERHGDGKILELELSAQDIANLVERSKSTIEAALRWLGCGAIEYEGIELCRGIGWLHRRRRYGRGYLDGVLRWLCRTSSIVLTLMGRAALKLALRSDERRVRRRVRGAEGRKAGAAPLSAANDNRDTAEAQSARERAGASREPPDDAAELGGLSDEAAEARRRIRSQLNID